METEHRAAKQPKRIRTPRFTIEFPGDSTAKDRIKDKLERVKTSLFDKSETNTAVVEALLDAYMEAHHGVRSTESVCESFASCNNYEAERIYLLTHSALNNIISVASNHKSCTGTMSVVAKQSVISDGFANRLTMQCSRTSHCPNLANTNLFWTSCKYGSKFTINIRLPHAYFSTGLLPSQFESLMSTLGVRYQTTVLRREITQYSQAVSKVIKL